MVACPICGKIVNEARINLHLDSSCRTHIEDEPGYSHVSKGNKSKVSGFFRSSTNHAATHSISETLTFNEAAVDAPGKFNGAVDDETVQRGSVPATTKKRPAPEHVTPLGLDEANGSVLDFKSSSTFESPNIVAKPPTKRVKPSSTTSALHRAQPLAERMRPRNIDEVHGQSLLKPTGVLRGLIEADKVPSMILWGNAGTGKTTIARIMASQTGARFIELNSTSTGVAELKKIFAEARSDLTGVAGRKTMVFCDEIHRFSKSQQDVFLGPVEAGVITLIGATTENPSFKVQNALLSRCRVFTLQKLDVKDVKEILSKAIEGEGDTYGAERLLVDEEMIMYLAAFADGDARTGLNLLELAMELSGRKGATKEGIKSSLTKTLVYDRAGDQHYDTISAFHKSIRGSDPHAALYYLARMVQSGEDALYIARRMVVIASEDVGLADNSLLTLATSTYAAAEKIGLPEARINLAHCTVALALAPKSTRAYRGLENAMAALKEPGVAGLPIALHLRNAPTRLMKENGYGKEYKYNPRYVNGRVKQEYMPAGLEGREFLEDRDLGLELDDDLDDEKQPNVRSEGLPFPR